MPRPMATYWRVRLVVGMPIMDGRVGVVGVFFIGSQSSSTSAGIGDAAVNWTRVVARRPTRRVRKEGMLYAETEVEVMEELDVGNIIRRRGQFRNEQEYIGVLEWDKVLERMSNQLI